MEFDFDPLAKRYAGSIKELPQSYIRLIASTFNLHATSRIIDMGCGSGLLTVPLAKYSNFVFGVDISHQMIEIAKSQPSGSNVFWVEKDIEHYDFQACDLIISYESIHLFPNTAKLLQKCADGLNKNAYLCMGWCFYNWELLLEHEIVTTFKKHGVDWGEWSYQKFNKFYELIDSKKIKGLTPTKNAHIGIYQEWQVSEIVEYITSISKALNLTEGENIHIQSELMDAIKKKHGNVIKGDTQFWIRYSQRR